MIYLSFTDFDGVTSGTVFIVCIATLVLLIACIAFCASRGCRNGPYVKNSFHKGTLMRSFWQIRPINSDKYDELKKPSALSGPYNDTDKIKLGNLNNKDISPEKYMESHVNYNSVVPVMMDNQPLKDELI